MNIRILSDDVTGWIAGVYHPQPGMELNVDDKIGKALCSSGRAEPVVERQAREAAIVEVVENAAETTERPRVTKPRKNVKRKAS